MAASGVNQAIETLPVTPDIAALKQKGIIQNRGFFGDPALSEGLTKFNQAAAIASSLSGVAQSVMSISESSKRNTTRNKTSNYFLYDKEKSLLAGKAKQYSDYGLIPYDVMKEFLEILVSVPTYEDLAYIAQVTGIKQLDDPNLVREPLTILGLSELFKVGYLATAVATITKEFDPAFSTQSAIDQGAGLFGNILGAIANGEGLKQFGPVVDVLSSMTNMTSTIGSLQGITSSFSSFSGMGDIAALSGVRSQMSSLASTLTSTSSLISKANINSMMSTAIDMKKLSVDATNLDNMAKQLQSITMIPPGNDPRVADIATQMANINTKAGELLSKVSAMSSQLSAFPIPSIGGSDIGTLLNKLGGQATSGTISKLVTGQDLPPAILYKNPMLVSPSYIGKAFMGELSGVAVAVGEVFPKKIATYAEEQGSVGTVTFGMQNFGSFASDGMFGGLDLTSLISKLMFNSSSIPTSEILQELLDTKVNQVASILNVATDSVVETRRSDNAIPFMIGFASAMVEDTRCPIKTSVFSSAWKLSASVGNDLQNYNPQFLANIRISL